MNIKAPPGVFDILPDAPNEEWRSSHLWNYVEMMIRETAEQYGFREIRTPVLERTELFHRGVGEGTDIVSKEMYTFEDKGGRSLSLRPEGTAPAIRSFVEHHLSHDAPIHKLYYIGPMFRYERAQAGRYRQHHQFGAEIIGSASPEQDAELIDLLYTLYTRLGLRDLKVRINSIGDRECRNQYREALKEYLGKSFDSLSEDSQRRFEVNPLRILDSKDPKDRAIVAEAPSIIDYLSDDCRSHFQKVQQCLSLLGIPFVVDCKIVRGLDYYNRTVFEVVAEELGSQNSIGGGGRYDELVGMLGGPELPALGFGTGIERIIQVLLRQNAPVPPPPRPLIYLIPLGEEAKLDCFKILHDLRAGGIRSDMDLTGKKLRKAMNYADSIQAKYVAVIGETELKTREVELKNMKSGEVIAAPLDHLKKIMRIEMGAEDFIRIWKEMSVPFEHPLEAKFFLDNLQGSIDSTKSLVQVLESAMKKMEDLL